MFSVRKLTFFLTSFLLGIITSRLYDQQHAVTCSNPEINSTNQITENLIPSSTTPRPFSSPQTSKNAASVEVKKDADLITTQSPLNRETLPNSLEPTTLASQPNHAANIDDSKKNEIDKKLQHLLQERLPEGRIVAKDTKKDGTVRTHEQFDDGSTIDRAFTQTGALKGERMFLSSGEQVQRSYYDSGQIKGLSWSLTDGTIVNVKLSPNGLYEGRSDLLVDGERLITKYDGNGQVSEQWKVKKSGQRIRII